MFSIVNISANDFKVYSFLNVIKYIIVNDCFVICVGTSLLYRCDSMAAQTLSGLVAKAIDFLRDDLSMAEFQESEDTCEFIRKVDTAFNLLNSRNPFAKSTKQPVTLEYLPDWAEECENLETYLFNLKDDKGRLLRNGRRKTPIWGFTFSLLSIKAITEELLTCTHHPYKFVLHTSSHRIILNCCLTRYADDMAGTTTHL